MPRELLRVSCPPQADLWFHFLSYSFMKLLTLPSGKLPILMLTHAKSESGLLLLTYESNDQK